MEDMTEMFRARAAAALAPVEGTLRARGLREPVEVLRDRWGVPHIYAGSTHDLYLAQGFVTASERLFQLETALRLGLGRLSEAFGELLLPIDRFVRTVGWNRAGRRQADQHDELSLEMVDAFAAGARAWVEAMPALPLEYETLGLQPWIPEGREAREASAATGVFMAWSLSGNWDAELLRAEVAERLGWEAVHALFPDLPAEAPPAVPGRDGGERSRRATLELLRRAPALPHGQGSNNWAVSGRRTVTGAPLLANDPHLLAQLPSAWFEVHLEAPGVAVRGVALPFAPGVIIGHNDRIAWGQTNVGGDTQDLYLERLSEDGAAALYEGLWEPLTVHREEIVVRGRPQPDVVEVRETRHGPILDSYMIGIANPQVVAGGIRETYALRWVGLDETVKPSTVHRLDTAANWDEFRAAVADWHCPGQNFVYADVDGNIGYQCTGVHPVRRRGDGTVPVPGWTDEYEWEGWVPFDELPRAYNPEQGFLVTANQRPHDEAYPYLLGRDFVPPYRARRIAELLTARPAHDAASFARIQVDTLSLPAMEVVPRLLEIRPRDDRQRQALAVLAEWDFDMAADSAGAALYQVWGKRIAEAVLRPRLDPELFRHYFGLRQWTNTFLYLVLPHLLRYPTAEWFGADGVDARDEVVRSALDAALDELSERLGPDPAGWRWGDLHRIRLAGQLAMLPHLATLFTGAEAPLAGDEQTVLQGLFEPGRGSYDGVIVPSWRMVVDLSNLDASVGVLPLGQSGNPASPHFNDQFALWIEGRHHPLPFTRAAVEASAAGRLELVPSEAPVGNGDRAVVRGPQGG